jgi:hypothetical protein
MAANRIIESLRTHSVLVIIALVGIFYALTIRPGLPWGDDFAMYLMHARNLATGMPYSATGYVYNPSQPEVGPPSYPPLFPVIIAPAVAIAGFNTYLLKGEVAVCFLAALWMIYRYVRRQVPEIYALGIVAVVGFNPYCWQLKDNIASDVPFLLLIFLTYNRLVESDQKQSKSIGNALFVGLLLYLCFACRIAGIVILPSWFAFEVIKRRGFPRPAVWISGGVALSAMLLQVLMLRGETSRNEQLGGVAGWAVQGVGVSREVMLQHVREYAWSLRNDWFHVGGIAGWALLVLFGLLGLAGYFLVIKRALGAMEIFVAAYAVMIALWAADQDMRFLLPLMPLWLMYASVALVRLGGLGFKRISFGLTAAAALIFVASDATYYLRAHYGPTPGGTNDQGFVSMARFVRQDTPTDATIIFSKPRLLALVSDRKSAVYPLTGTADDVIRYCQQIGARYVIDGDPFENDRRVLAPIIAEHPDRFELMFQSAGFRLYRLRDEPARAGYLPASTAGVTSAS